MIAYPAWVTQVQVKILLLQTMREENKWEVNSTNPFRGGGRWGQLVLPMLHKALCCLGVGQTLLDICVEPLAKDININFVDIDLKLLLEFIQVLLLLAASPHGGAWRSELDWDAARISHDIGHTEPGKL